MQTKSLSYYNSLHSATQVARVQAFRHIHSALTQDDSAHAPETKENINEVESQASTSHS
jgi:hypothetical protein